MSFLGGFDLGSKFERNALALRRDLALQRNDRRTPANFHFANGADLVLTHGELRAGRQLPDAYALAGPQSECYMNAMRAAEADSSVLYCEGYWLCKDVTILHGWGVAPDNGVLELTFPTEPDVLASQPMHPILNIPWSSPEDWAYFGVVFDVRLVREHFESIGLPMLTRTPGERGQIIREGLPIEHGDWHHFPVLKHHYNPFRTEVPK